MSEPAQDRDSRVRLEEIAELSAALPPNVVKRIYAQVCAELIAPYPELRRFAKPKERRPSERRLKDKE